MPTKDPPPSPIPHCCLLVPQPPLGLSFSGSVSSLLQCRAPTGPSPPTSCPPPQPAWPCAPDPALLTSFLTHLYWLPPESPQLLCHLYPPKLRNVFLCWLCGQIRHHQWSYSHLSWELPSPQCPLQHGHRMESAVSSPPCPPYCRCLFSNGDRHAQLPWMSLKRSEGWLGARHRGHGC